MPGSSEKTILVVEDDNRVSEAVCKYLTKHGFSCVPLQEGKKAVSYLSRVNLVLLDLNLPDTDGLDVLQELRRKSSLPVMIMSARGEGHQRILGLEMGADDYVVKLVLPESSWLGSRLCSGEGVCKRPRRRSLSSTRRLEWCGEREWRSL